MGDPGIIPGNWLQSPLCQAVLSGFVRLILKAPQVLALPETHKSGPGGVELERLCQAYMTTLLLLHASVLNSGPLSNNTGINFPSGTCSEPVTWDHRGVCCDACNAWYHAHCQDIHTVIYECMEFSNISWQCLKCGMPTIHPSAFEYVSTNETSFHHSVNTSHFSLSSQSSPGPPIDICPHPFQSQNGTRNRKSNLRLLNLNCKSVWNKQGQFQAMIDSGDPDIVVATETWLTPHHAYGEIREPDRRFSSDYKIYHGDRITNTQGGGVFLAVRNGIRSTG